MENVLLLVLMSIGMYQIASAEEVEQPPPETVEEIIVYGDKSLPALRREVYKAQENFFDVFSTLNKEHEYDVRCFYDVPTGTHIRRHVCRAYFVSDATSAEYLSWKDGPQTPVVQAGAVIQIKKKQLREKMEKLISERPELLQALINYADARQRFESEKNRK